MDTTNRSERLLIELRTGTQSSVGDALRCLPSILCLIAAGIWLVRPEVGPWPLILVALALVARRLTTHARVLGTPFDRPLFFFVLAAALGAWIAYSQQAGWNRFWLIIAGNNCLHRRSSMRRPKWRSEVRGVSHRCVRS